MAWICDRIEYMEHITSLPSEDAEELNQKERLIWIQGRTVKEPDQRGLYRCILMETEENMASQG